MTQKEAHIDSHHIRDPLFDISKALMMFWVVWGHFSRYGVVAGPLEPAPYMGRIKILLNMPVFFIIGGYLSFLTFKKGSWSKIIARIIGFLWPMAAFSLVFTLVLIILNGWHGWHWLALYLFKQVIHEHWFLRTFAAIYLFSALIYRILPSDRSRWFGFAIVWCVLLFWPSRFKFVLVWLGSSQTLYMFPFFIFGVMILRRFPFWHSTRIAVICIVFVLTVVLLESDDFAFRMNFWNAPSHWRGVLFDSRNLLALFCRTLVGMTGTVSILWCVDSILRRFPAVTCLAPFGTTTLGVYILHEWPLIQIGQAGLSFLPLACWARLPLAFTWLLICHFAIMCIRRIPIFSIFFLGDEKRLALFIDGVYEYFKSHS